MTAAKIRILIADDHRMFREAIRHLLEAEQHFEVAGEAANGEELVKLASATQADVLLLDLAMPGRLSGVDALAEIEARNIPIRTIVLTGSTDSGLIMQAVRLGARGVVLKDASIELLTKCIGRVVAGEYWIGHERMAQLVEMVRHHEGETRRPADMLTRRERQVVAAVAQGATNREIAAQYGMSAQTVKNHLSNIFDKLGVSTRLELALFAVNHKIADEEDPPLA